MADLGGGGRNRHMPSTMAQNVLNFMHFLENLTKSYVGAPWRVGSSPTGNPGSAPGNAKCRLVFKTTQYQKAVIGFVLSLELKNLLTSYILLPSEIPSFKCFSEK